jgi:hypothetical protein
VQGNQVGFESSFQQHLDTEQRRAVLEAIGASINPDSTLGEILDAAEALGWSEKMGDLSLSDLAEALLAPEGDAGAARLESPGEDAEALASEGDDEDEDDLDEDDLDEDDLDEDEDDLDEDEDDDEQLELEVEEPVASRRKAGKTKVAAKAAKEPKLAKKKVTTKKGPAKKALPVAPAKKSADRQARPPEKGSSKKAAKAAPAPSPSKKVAKKAPPVVEKAPAPSKKGGKRKLTAVDVDDRMSLDQAAEFFLPYVEDLGDATMQALEEQTGVSRRKLRFHVGQLVKHGYLERHGMGRGTYYTKV